MGLSNSSYALDINFQVWAWGDNTYGQLGDNSSGNSKSSPVLVVGSHSFVEISGGYSHSLARKADGTVWSWGLNSSGQLGDNSIVSKSSPVLVVGGIPLVSLDFYSRLQYRHGATPDVVNDAAWNAYRDPFLSLGYVQVKVKL